MALFTDRQSTPYARRTMPQAPRGDGPWGEAIQYWLRARNKRQADLASDTGVRANTISRAARGFDTTTRVLRKIADALDAPLDSVLVSPERKLANEDRRRLIQEITELVVRTVETKHGPEEPLDRKDAESLTAMETDLRSNVAERSKALKTKRLPRQKDR